MDEFGWLEENEAESVPTVVGTVDGELQVKPRRKRRPAELIRAERQLTVPQRLYIELLLVCPTIVAANTKMREAGYGYTASTFQRWRKNPNFGRALDLTTKYMVEVLGISKESVLLDAEKIKQLALTPQPVLYKGRHTGFMERELGAALRALELQGKGVGIQDGESGRVQVNIDIDFSGRRDDPPPGVTIDGG